MPTIVCPKCGGGNDDTLKRCGRCGHPFVKAPAGGAVPGSGAGATPGRAGSPGAGERISFHRGQVVAGRYTVLNMIGRGGMGCIHLVHDNTLNEEVALKTLLPQFARDTLVVERFLNEARIARQLSHPNVCRVHDIGLDGDVMYISMEYMKGRSLRAILDHQAPGQRLPVKTTLDILDQLCAALEYAHRFTIHRDIKPENVMVLTDGSVKLMDFGISKLMTRGNLTTTSVVMGTPQYMPPEQLKDSRGVDARADIYSVGIVLYEMLTGNLPTGIPRPASQVMSDVPPPLDPIIAKCVDPNPANRFQNVGELREALRPIRQALEGGTAAVLTQKPASKRNLGPILRGVAGVAAILIVLFIMALGLGQAERHRRALLGAVSSAAEGAQATAVGADPQRDAILQEVEAARAGAPVPEGDVERQRVRECGDRFYEQARAAWAAGDPQTAAQQARYAFECFTALKQWPADNSMTFIPAGDVLIGDTPVWVDGFFIDRYEVTNAQFAAFAAEHKWRTPVGVDGQLPVVGGAYYDPQAQAQVEGGTFYDAQAYAAAQGKRLPTEAQWARAAYGYEGASSTFPWGATWAPGAANMGAPAAEEKGAEAAETAPAEGQQVAAEPPGSFEKDRTAAGCFDMAGNVAEWTRTAYRDLPYDPRDGREDESALTFGSTICVRGGSFNDEQPVPLTERFSQPYEKGAIDLGFRCVREIGSMAE